MHVSRFSTISTAMAIALVASEPGEFEAKCFGNQTSVTVDF